MLGGYMIVRSQFAGGDGLSFDVTWGPARVNFVIIVGRINPR